MRIFIAGATGVLGRRVVHQLIANGHEVIGLCRSAQNSNWLRHQGATPRQGDLFNLEGLIRITDDCDATLHLATAMPTKSRTTARDWALNDRIRREGTENLLAAALRNNHKFYLQQSITLLYGDQGGNWVDESNPLPEKQLDLIQSAVDMEKIVRRAGGDGLPATILRLGRFYSYDSAHTQSMFQMVKKGLFPVIGKGDFFWHLINVDDAASAVVQAVGKYHHCLDQTFNVCDDEPILFNPFLNFVANTLGARSPFHIPVWLAKLMLGSSMVQAMMLSTRCRNERFKEATGWQPEFPTYRTGIVAEVSNWLNPNPPSHSSTRHASSNTATH